MAGRQQTPPAPGDRAGAPRSGRRVLTASDRALLVECADLDATLSLHRALEHALADRTTTGGRAAGGLGGIEELVPAARTILVRFDPLTVSAAALTDMLYGFAADPGAVATSDAVTVEVHYDGEDLAEVADLLGTTGDELVRRHSAALWQVAFCGFAPGFGYLVCDDPLFDVPRRPSPRTRVPAGAVGLAGQFTGVYPRESPGGWQLIGHTDAVMWDLDRDPPALLAPGVTVRFRPVRARATGIVDPPEDPAGSTGDATSATGTVVTGPAVTGTVGAGRADAGTADAGTALIGTGDTGTVATGSALIGTPVGGSAVRSRIRALEVVRPGAQVLVQDRGRPGLAALGVSAAGAADHTALADANRAVGNDPGAAALELVGGGASLRFRGAGVAAVTGATVELGVSSADGTGRPVGHGVPFAVDDGDELTLGVADAGLRAVIAVRGGIVTPDTLGSRATDTLAGLGPAPLTAGDLLAVGDPGDAPYAVDPTAPARPPLPRAGETVALDIVLGPRDDWFTDEAVRLLQDQAWLVTPRSDRVGIRLQGEAGLERARAGELPSEGVVTGAIQVPPDGQPVLFLPDHPLTGGYPVIAAVVDRDLDVAGQLPPGAYVRFRVG